VAIRGEQVAHRQSERADHILGLVTTVTDGQGPAIIAWGDPQPVGAAGHGAVTGATVAVHADVLEAREH